MINNSEVLGVFVWYQINLLLRVRGLKLLAAKRLKLLPHLEILLQQLIGVISSRKGEGASEICHRKCVHKVIKSKTRGEGGEMILWQGGGAEIG